MVDTSGVKPTYKLVDVVLRASSSPKFYVPAASDRKHLCRGDMAKLIFNDEERMWVSVTEVEGLGWYRGELRNHPVSVPLRYGDEVRFHARHVADISAMN